jgi:hypothetical protein
MSDGYNNLAQVRLANALRLFDEFVQSQVNDADAVTLRGLEGRFAERLQIQPSYWSQIKGRSRQIGERLARQFEALCSKPAGWMDAIHPPRGVPDQPARAVAAEAASGSMEQMSRSLPHDADERFIVSLVLSYYRRHPHTARTRLLDLLGEALTPPAGGPPSSPAPAAVDDGQALWKKARASVNPLKKAKR